MPVALNPEVEVSKVQDFHWVTPSPFIPLALKRGRGNDVKKRGLRPLLNSLLLPYLAARGENEQWLAFKLGGQCILEFGYG